jgi:hypothetical protein
MRLSDNDATDALVTNLPLTAANPNRRVKISLEPLEFFMDVSSATQAISTPPPKARAADEARAQEYHAEQQKAAERAQEEARRNMQPVVNTQGQTTGRLVNATA